MTTDSKGGRVENPLVNLKGQVRGWEEMKGFLPPGLSDDQMSALQTYFDAQKSIKERDLQGANDIFNRILLKRDDYLKMEEDNAQLLAAIDLLVRGETNMSDKPELTFKTPLN